MVKRARLTISLLPGRIRAEARRGATTVWSAEAGYGSMDELGEAIARLTAEAADARPPRSVLVRIHRPLVQRRTLNDLPPVPQRLLPALVAGQAGRFFRKNGVPLITDARWTGSGGKRVSAHAVAVEETIVGAVQAGAAAAGLRLDDIVPEGETMSLSLLPAAVRRQRRRAVRYSLLRLGLVVAGAWIVVAALYVGRLSEQRKSVESELAALARPMAALMDLKREMRGARQAIEAVEDRDHRRVVALEALAGITAALPDSSFLSSFTLDSLGRGHVTGLARRTTAVLAALDRSPGLRRVQLVGSVGREIMGGVEWERFTIGFEVRRSEER